MKTGTNSFKIQCKQKIDGVKTLADESGLRITLYHKDEEPEGVNRLLVEKNNVKAEFLPSKGLSLGQIIYKGKKLFWDAPYDLPDPEELDLWSEEVMINNVPSPGFAYIPTFAAGIEFYGMKNWGMPYQEERTGRIYPLHGETSNIPVDEVQLEIFDDKIKISTEYIYREMKQADPQPWYENGTPLYRIRKSFELNIAKEPELEVIDSFKNISGEEILPDWGYHITFFPEPGSEIIVESEKRQLRGNGVIGKEPEVWLPSTRPGRREETGIIHKEVKKVKTNGKEEYKVIIKHPDGRDIELFVPPTPYFQTWSCCGGAGSDEFILKNGKSLLEKNWDGIGIEIGSGSLDHDGNTDESVPGEETLDAGEEREVRLRIKF